MPTSDGSGIPANIESPESCRTKANLIYAAWGRFSEMQTWTLVSDEVTVLAPIATKNMHLIKVDALKANLAGEFQDDNGYYDSSVAFDLENMTKESSKSIVDQQDFCDIFVYTKWSDGNKIFMGVDVDNGAVVQNFKQKQRSHSFTKGGEDNSTNIVTIGFKTLRDVLYTTIEPAALPLV